MLSILSLSLSLCLSLSFCMREMKVQCDVCEKTEASVMCCADEAALCAECDGRIHRANKLASKHQRLGLLYPTPEERTCCDICQDKVGFFFCLEDRALLCRSCDYSIHSANALTAKHKRFLVAGIRVTLEASPLTNESSESAQTCPKSQVHSSAMKVNDLNPSNGTPLPKVTSDGSTDSQESYKRAPSLDLMSRQSVSLNVPNHISYEQTEKCGTINVLPLKSEKLLQALPVAAPGQEVMVVSPSKLAPVPENPLNHQMHLNLNWDICPSVAGVQANNVNVGSVVSNQTGATGFARKSSISEYLTEAIPGWRVDELLSLTDASSAHNLVNCGSSKTDAWNFGESDWQADCSLIEELMLAQGPAEVPSLSSPPTSSGALRSTRVWGGGKFMKSSDFDCLLECEDAPTVPDISASSPIQSPFSPPPKRRRIGVNF